MKKILVATALAAAISSAGAGPYAPQEFDFTELDAMAHGTVAKVREVRLEQDLFEHSVRPETAAQLLILLDDGRSVVLYPAQMQRFEAGQRVRVVGGPGGARVEHE